MFTGLIQDMGKIREISKHREDASFRIESTLSPYESGESIAVNGACLTVEKFDADSFSVFTSKETLLVTGMDKLQTGSRVNLERAMTLNDAVGGHLVSGHVDTRVSLLQRIKTGLAEKFIFKLPDDQQLKKQIAPKGSVTVNGVSLTVNNVTDSSFEIMIIPVTLKETTLFTLKPGDTVNIETDILAKYVARFLDTQHAANKQNTLDISMLQENGFLR